MVNVSVQLFAGLRERHGADRVELELADGATVADVMAAIGVGERECVVAVNRDYATADTRIASGDEIALVPPVSGGEGPVRHARLSDAPLDIAQIAAAVRDPRAGAVVTFEGVTRVVDALDYEAYAAMAEQRMHTIAAEEAERHGLVAVAVEHRTGRVPLSEPSVLIAAAAPHRAEAFEGARAILDRIKAEAPIWKVEETSTGRRRVEGTLPTAP